MQTPSQMFHVSRVHECFGMTMCIDDYVPGSVLKVSALGSLRNNASIKCSKRKHRLIT